MAKPRIENCANDSGIYRPNFPGEASKEAKDKVQSIVLDALAVLGKTRAMIEAWREAVFRGSVAFASERDDSLKNDLQSWLDDSKNRALPMLVEFEREQGYNTVPRSEELRTEITRVEDQLRQWTEPRLSMAQGLREDCLTDEESEGLLEAHNRGTAKPKLKPKRMSSSQ